MGRGRRHNCFSRWDRTREGDMANIWMLTQYPSCFFPMTGDYIDNARGYSNVFEQLNQENCA